MFLVLSHFSSIFIYLAVLGPVFLPGEFHGQRSLVGYSPWNHKELGLSGGPQDLWSSFHHGGFFYLWHVRSSSLTRDRTWPLHWKHRVLATGPPGKSLFSIPTLSSDPPPPTEHICPKFERHFFREHDMPNGIKPLRYVYKVSCTSSWPSP